MAVVAAASEVLVLLASGVLASLKHGGQGVNKWVNAKLQGPTAMAAWGNVVVVGARDSTCRIFAVSTLQHMATLPKASISTSSVRSLDPPVGVSNLAVSPDSSALAVLSEDGTLSAWDITDFHKLGRQRVARLSSGPIWDIAVSHHGGVQTAATCGSDGMVRIWGLDVPSNAHRSATTALTSCLIARDDGQPVDLRCVRWNPEGSEMALGDMQGNIHIVSISMFGEVKKSRTLEAHDGEVLSLDYVIYKQASGVDVALWLSLLGPVACFTFALV